MAFKALTLDAVTKEVMVGKGRGPRPEPRGARTLRGKESWQPRQEGALQSGRESVSERGEGPTVWSELTSGPRQEQHFRWSSE